MIAAAAELQLLTDMLTISCFCCRLFCSAAQERSQLLDQAATSGVIQNYEGVRVSLSGKKFRIKGVTLFNVEDMEGDTWGCCCSCCHARQSPLLIAAVMLFEPLLFDMPGCLIVCCQLSSHDVNAFTALAWHMSLSEIKGAR